MEVIDYIPSDSEVPLVATGNLSSGDIVQAGGLPGFVMEIQNKEAGSTVVANSGDTVMVRVRGLLTLACAQATTFAVGATVGWDDTNKLCVAGGSGDFDLGKAVLAVTNQQTRVQVRLAGA